MLQKGFEWTLRSKETKFWCLAEKTYTGITTLFNGNVLMKIDITQAPLSTDVIAQQRSLLADEITKLETKRRLIIRWSLAIVVFVLLLSIIGNAEYGWLQWWTFTSAFALAFNFTVAVAVVSCVFMEKLGSPVENCREKQNQLSDAPKESCLSIVKWLDDPVIAAFRDAVLGEGRQFIVGEVEEMERHFNSRDERDKEIEYKNAVEDACRTVYVSNLTGDSAG